MGFVLIYYILRYRRNVVKSNLESSFPEKSKEELKEIERKFYRWFADYFIESVKLLSISKEELSKRLTIHNAEDLVL